MELISKDALLKELGITDEDCEKCAWGDKDGHGYCTRGSEFTDACDAICTAPVIEERKTGKWIQRKGMYEIGYKCSECDAFSLTETSYCAKCGAKMEGEQP